MDPAHVTQLEAELRTFLEPDETAAQLFARVSVEPVHTGIFFAAAVKPGFVLEVAGPSGCCKTEVLIQAAAKRILPETWRGCPLGGHGEHVIYIDLDAKLDPLRLLQVLHSRVDQEVCSRSMTISEDDINALCEATLARFHLVTCDSSFDFLATLHGLPPLLENMEANGGIRLLLIDNVAAHYWTDRGIRDTPHAQTPMPHHVQPSIYSGNPGLPSHPRPNTTLGFSSGFGHTPGHSTPWGGGPRTLPHHHTPGTAPGFPAGNPGTPIAETLPGSRLGFPAVTPGFPGGETLPGSRLGFPAVTPGFPRGTTATPLGETLSHSHVGFFAVPTLRETPVGFSSTHMTGPAAGFSSTHMTGPAGGHVGAHMEGLGFQGGSAAREPYATLGRQEGFQGGSAAREPYGTLSRQPHAGLGLHRVHAVVARELRRLLRQHHLAAIVSQQSILTPNSGNNRPDPWAHREVLPRAWQDIITQRVLLRRIPPLDYGLPSSSAGPCTFGAKWQLPPDSAVRAFIVTDAALQAT